MARPHPRRPPFPATRPRYRRWLPGAIVAALALPLSVTMLPPAAASAATTSSTTAPPTTAAPTPPAPTAPRSTTPTTAAPGVPRVPTGAGAASSTPPAGGAATASLPIVSAVQADLDQMQAIATVTQARQGVTTAKSNQASAQTALSAAQATWAAAQNAVTAARATLQQSVKKLSSIAVAAYTGAAYGTPAAAPANLPGQIPGVVTGGGTTQSDADELMNLVTQQVKQRVAAAQAQVVAATATLNQTAAGVQRAQATAKQAAAAVTAAQAALTQTLRGATVSGAAFAHQQTAGAASPSTKPRAGGADTGADGSPTILGPPVVTAAELYGWYTSTHHTANTTVPIGQMAADYIAASKTTGVRGDLAFAQSIIETGYFSFPAGGQLVSRDNNFAGIGACDSCAHGFSFPNAMTGVTAQEQLLEVYASKTKVSAPLVGSVGVGGCCQTWMALAGKWATDRQYGISILTVYKQILDYAIPEALVGAGLAPAGSAPPLPALPAGPSTSPLPAALPATAPPTTAPQPPTLAQPGT